MKRNNPYIWLLFYLLLIVSSSVSGQNIDFSKKNPEEQFDIVKKLAFDGQYEKARQLGYQTLDSIPNYHDVTLLIARTFLWENQFDSAKVLIDNVLNLDPENIEAKEAQLDLAYFSKNQAEVKNIAAGLIEQDPEKIDYREKYAIALLSSSQKTLAGNQTDSILSRDSLNTVALDIKRQLEPKPIKRPYELTLGYSFDHFSEPYNRWWHLYTTGLKRNTDWGSIEGRINIGHLASEAVTELQAEIESYITLSKSNYAMLLYGYSPHTHFPNHKAAVEVWQKLPEAFIVSLGLNYYHWDSNDIFIGTASLEKYLGKYWLCFRTYVHFKDVGVSGSYYFTARRYLDDVDYFQVTLGLGTAPDEPYDIQTDLERLSAYSVRCLFNKQLNNRWIMRAGLGYAYEEYRTDSYRNRFDGTISFVYSFGR